MSDYHIPVLLKEAIWYLNVRPGERYIDCTLGSGGHTKAIIAAGGTVLGLDQDREAIEYNQKDKKELIGEKKLILRQGNFAHLKDIADEENFSRVAGVLFDLGVSSHQLEADYRGFSFRAGQLSKLDMRMDPENQTVTAADLVNAGSLTELANLFWKFGEERENRKIARAIVDYRRQKKIETTDELAKIILSARHASSTDRTHPATRVFLALRIAVNDEIGSLEVALPQARQLLKKDGRLVAISFHSLEDRIVKDFFRKSKDTLRVLTIKPVTPAKLEILRNPRARSGKLRAAEKIK